MSTLELLGRLVSFKTVSSESNLSLIDFVAEFLAHVGFDCKVLPSANQSKANLVASLGPRVAGGILFSGHSDVVPTTGQDWMDPPFEMQVRDGRAIGRGTADMKGFIAALLARVAVLQEGDLAHPIHIALSYDEELGCLGTPELIDYINQSIPPPRAVIVGEPTQMRLVTGHKGATVCRTRVIGQEAHSSVPHLGCNAIAVAGRLLSVLSKLEEDARCTMANSRLPATTVSVNQIEGGTATNIVPRHCSFTWDVRGVSQAPVRSILDRFEAECVAISHMFPAQPVNLTTTVLTRVPPLAMDIHSPAAELVARLLDNPEPEVMAIGSEAGMFQAAGYSAVLCGPGSIAQAHQANEYVELEQLNQCEAFIDGLIESVKVKSSGS